MLQYTGVREVVHLVLVPLLLQHVIVIETSCVERKEKKKNNL